MKNNNRKKTIVFIIDCIFPYGAAWSSRARNFIKLISDSGYHVHVIAIKNENGVECKELDSYDVSYTLVDYKTTYLNLAGFGCSGPFLRALNEYLANNTIDCIFSKSMPFVQKDINKIAKMYNVPYIVEQCEWYDESIFKLGKWNPYYRKFIKCITAENKNLSGIVAISTFFQNYYKEQKLPVILIPTILNVNDSIPREDGFGDVINISFFGSLGKGKENLIPIFEAFYSLGNDKSKFVFNLYGPSYNEIIDNLHGNEQLYNEVKDIVHIHGRISQALIENYVKQADYTIFTRPQRRSSDAGFPTKLAESMTVGTPVIANATGDVGKYVIDNHTGFIIKDDIVSSLVFVFKHILTIKPDEYIGMRKETYDMAKNFFDYRRYIDSFKSFIGDL